MRVMSWTIWAVACTVAGWLVVSQSSAARVYCAERVDVAKCDAWMEAGR